VSNPGQRVITTFARSKLPCIGLLKSNCLAGHINISLPLGREFAGGAALCRLQAAFVKPR
jgi:hypothetical protein